MSFINLNSAAGSCGRWIFVDKEIKNKGATKALSKRAITISATGTRPAWHADVF
jgi:hypothetical protein